MTGQPVTRRELASKCGLPGRGRTPDHDQANAPAARWLAASPSSSRACDAAVGSSATRRARDLGPHERPIRDVEVGQRRRPVVLRTEPVTIEKADAPDRGVRGVRGPSRGTQRRRARRRIGAGHRTRDSRAREDRRRGRTRRRPAGRRARRERARARCDRGTATIAPRRIARGVDADAFADRGIQHRSGEGVQLVAGCAPTALPTRSAAPRGRSRGPSVRVSWNAAMRSASASTQTEPTSSSRAASVDNRRSSGRRRISTR